MATTAILQYVSEGTYPDSESISSTNLTSADLSTLLQSLKDQQESARDSIRNLSHTTGPDISTWISQAKALQEDILRSRETARQIVQEAETGQALRAEVEDAGKKVGLLEREVEFNETLTGTLEHITHARSLLERAQEEAVKANVEAALDRLEDAEASIFALPLDESSRACETLKERTQLLKANLVETATECWNAFFVFDFDEGRFEVRKEGLRADTLDAAVNEISLEQIVGAVKRLGVFGDLVKKLSKDLENVVLRPRLVVDDDALVAKVKIFDRVIDLSGKRGGDLSEASIFKDLEAIVDFLATRLPPSITPLLSEFLMLALSPLLEERWLEPAIPLDISQVSAFTAVIEDLEQLLDKVEGHGWKSTQGMRNWIENSPTIWLTKQRENVLGEVRNLVFSGSKERKVVERVETRVVKKEDVVASVSSGEAVKEESAADEDGWESAWDEEQDDSSAQKPNQESASNENGNGDDEDASAWELDDNEIDQKDSSADAADDGEEDWGAWDDETSSKPPSPGATRKQPSGATAAKPNGNITSSTPPEQELTLRENLTVTSIPSHLLIILQRIISNAEALSTEQYSTSPLSSAARGLYQLPTLALAIYRATAPTTYSKIDVGNMLIYNDCLHLADLLRDWSTSRSEEAGRLRLDNDLVALETFGKKAYSSEMESQRTILRDILDGAQGFVKSDKAPWKTECESAVDGTVARVRDVQKLWKDVLASGALLQSLGSLLGTVTSKMISEIEDLGDISEAESTQLKALCDRVTALKDLFIQQPASHSSTQSDAPVEGQDMTFIYCPSWLKFQYLAEILESSLADIKWMWKEGELKLEFEAEEVVELIEALFAESELRRSAVREIRRGG